MALSRPEGAEDPTWVTLREAIYWHDRNSPRSMQQHLGPSELGSPCMRQLAFKMRGTPTSNTSADYWFAIMGTAMHEWLAKAIARWQNEVLGRERFLIEQRVTIAPESTEIDYGTNGSTDLYDTDHDEVIDWKLVGKDALKKYVEHGTPPTYQIQRHLYGRGWELRGYPVKTVKNIYLPRSNFLSAAHVDVEPYNRQIAEDALARAASIDKLRTILPIGMIPAAADEGDCVWCPFHVKRKHLSDASCPGH